MSENTRNSVITEQPKTENLVNNNTTDSIGGDDSGCCCGQCCDGDSGECCCECFDGFGEFFETIFCCKEFCDG